MLENVARQINAGRSNYAAGTLFGLRLTQKLLGLEKLAQGEDQEEITVTSYEWSIWQYYRSETYQHIPTEQSLEFCWH